MHMHMHIPVGTFVRVHSLHLKKTRQFSAIARSRAGVRHDYGLKVQPNSAMIDLASTLVIIAESATSRNGLLPCSLSSRNLRIAQWSLPCNLRLIVLPSHLNSLRLLSCSRHSSGTPPGGRSAAAAGARAHREPRAHRADGRGAFMSEDRGAHQREQGGRATSPRALGATLARLGQRQTGSAFWPSPYICIHR